jgi:hypothetical protein
MEPQALTEALLSGQEALAGRGGAAASQLRERERLASAVAMRGRDAFADDPLAGAREAEHRAKTLRSAVTAAVHGGHAAQARRCKAHRGRCAARLPPQQHGAARPPARARRRSHAVAVPSSRMRIRAAAGVQDEMQKRKKHDERDGACPLASR